MALALSLLALDAGLLLAVGAIGFSGAGRAVGELGPTIGFLAALLVLAEGCCREGVFAAIGGWMAAASRGRGGRLLAVTFAARAGVTAVLGLDATVVLLTRSCSSPRRGCGQRPGPTPTRARTWRTPPRCCWSSPT